jgi:hypothetical protein
MAKRRDQIEEAARLRAAGGKPAVLTHVRGVSVHCGDTRVLPASEGRPPRMVSVLEVGVRFVKRLDPVTTECVIEIEEGSSVKDEIALLGSKIQDCLAECAQRFEAILRKPVPPPPAPERESLHKVSGIEAIQRQAMLDRA